MDSNTENEVASALRYSNHSNRRTVSTHEPERIIKVVDGPEHHQSTMPRRRDHSGACQIEIDVLQHHNPLCDESRRQNIKDLPSEDVQGSYILIDRVPVSTCRNHGPLPEVPNKPALKKPTTVPNPASKFSIHDDHALLRGSRKGTQLNDPTAFDAQPSATRNTIENVMLLPKLGCSQPNFVARMEQKLPTKNRYDPTALPPTSKKSRPSTVVNAASTNQVKTPFDPQSYDKNKPSRPTSAQIHTTDANKSKNVLDPSKRQSPQGQKNLEVYSANTNKSKSAFDQCMDPSNKNKSKDHKSNTKVTPVYTTKIEDGKSPFNKHSAKLVHTCMDTSKDIKKDEGLVYKDKDGNVISKGCTPFGTSDSKQSVYAVVSKSSRVSFCDEKKVDKKPSILSHGNRSVDFSIRGVTYKTFKDPCFADNEGPLILTAGVKPPVIPVDPTSPGIFCENPNDISTMTSFADCCAPSCDVQVIGKPKENFREESGSEDELNCDSSQQTVATDTVSRIDTASKNPYYIETDRQQPKEGCFKKVFLCGACRKKPETTPCGDATAPSVVSQATSRPPSGYVPPSTGRPTSTASSRRPPSATSDRHTACKSHESQSPSVATGKSNKSHSKQGHNSVPSYRS